MPKFRASYPRLDPYRCFLESREYGERRHRPGVLDRLHKQMAHDMCTPQDKESKRSFPSHFESSESTFYTEEKYKHGKFYREEVPVTSPGGIFNMEFNSDGSILAAACERKCIFLFDPLSRKLVRTIENAHTDCVNCIRFLDSRTFATCSDDTTVALWDARNLKCKVRSLRGHSNWVKNIEYHSVSSQLVTSGFDGAIYSWDINKYSETEAEFKKVFYTNGLMRMRLTRDCSKMVVSTMSGLLLIIHDLELDHLATDLAGFKPNLYRLMQSTGKALEMTINYTKLFHAPRNRVELISDFPEGNDAQVLSSLRLHPEGWVALSRNTSSDENSEWCCVHDIQSLPTNPEEDELVSDRKPLTWRSGPAGGVLGSEEGSPSPAPVPAAPPILSPSPSISVSTAGDQPTNQLNIHTFRMSNSPDSDSGGEPSTGEGSQGPSQGPRVTMFRSGRLEIISSGVTSSSSEGGRPVIEIDLSISRRMRQERARRAERAREQGDGVAGEPQELEQDMYSRMVTIDREMPSPQNEGEEEESEEGGEAGRQRAFLILGTSLASRGRGRLLYFGTPQQHRERQRQGIPPDARIRRNVARLTHYIEESNTGKGFIKEQSFSPCGRIIASPFGHGVRLLGFNSGVEDLAYCVPDKPTKLYELGTMLGHDEVVLSSAFSPNNYLLATGCLSGRLVWHQPVL